MAKDNESWEAQLGFDVTNPQHRLAIELVRSTSGFIGHLANHRKAAGLSTEDVASSLDTNVETVEYFESGTTDPSISQIRQYCLAIGASISLQVLSVDPPKPK